jgi:Tetratricopeptide repeat.
MTTPATHFEKQKASIEKVLGERRFEQAERMLLPLLEEIMESKDEGFLIYALERMAEVQWYQGKLDDAAEYCQHLCRVYQEQGNGLPSGLVASSMNLAMICHTAKRFDEAASHYQKALQLTTSLLGEEHAYVAKLRSLYADLLQIAGKDKTLAGVGVEPRVVTVNDWQSAGLLELMKQRLRGTFEGEQPPASSPTSTADGLTAAQPAARQVVLVSLSKDEARRIYESNRICAERALAEGAVDYAEQLWLINLKLLKQFDVKELALANTLETLSEICFRRGDLNVAIDYYQEAYELKSRLLGPKDLAVAHAASHLGRMYYQASDYRTAESLVKKCTIIFEAVHGKEHPDVAGSLHNLATLYHVQRLYDHAEDAYIRSLEIKKVVYGDDHPETVRLLNSYAELLAQTKGPAAAAAIRSAAAAKSAPAQGAAPASRSAATTAAPAPSPAPGPSPASAPSPAPGPAGAPAIGDPAIGKDASGQALAIPPAPSESTGMITGSWKVGSKKGKKGSKKSKDGTCDMCGAAFGAAKKCENCGFDPKLGFK